MSLTLYRVCLPQSFRDLLGLVRVLDDGYLAIDNNTVDRAMRPIALGRHYAQHRTMRRSLRQDPLCVIPALLGRDTGPLPGYDRADSFWCVAEEAPGALTGVEAVFVAVTHAGPHTFLG